MYKHALKRRGLLLIALLAAADLSACSVYMAAAGDDQKNISNVRQGTSRSEVELAMGSPINTSASGDGKTLCVYQYTVGNEPSGGRAIGHAALDLLTLGLWEVVGTGIEATQQGDIYNLTVTYDNDNKVSAIQSHKVK